MIKDFRDFIMRGNVLDLAVAVIIGAAFGAIVKSFVDDILMPPIGLLLGGVDFSNLFITLSGDTFSTLAAAKKAGSVTLNFGLFLNTVINFLIVAFAIFLVLRAVKKAQEMNKQEEEEAAQPAPPEPSAEEKLLAEIRDLLKAQNR